MNDTSKMASCRRFSACCFRARPQLVLTLFRQELFDRLQFESPLGGGPGMRHLEALHGVHDDLRDDQPGVDLVVGGNDVPWRMMSAGSTEAIFVGLHVLLPVLPFVNVGRAELPVLFRLVDPRKESLPLFLVG